MLRGRVGGAPVGGWVLGAFDSPQEGEGVTAEEGLLVLGCISIWGSQLQSRMCCTGRAERACTGRAERAALAGPSVLHWQGRACCTGRAECAALAGPSVLLGRVCCWAQKHATRGGRGNLLTRNPADSEGTVDRAAAAPTAPSADSLITANFA